MDVPTITVEELTERLAAGAPLLDVRQPDEYQEAHVPGARLLPLDELPDKVRTPADAQELGLVEWAPAEEVAPVQGEGDEEQHGRHREGRPAQRVTGHEGQDGGDGEQDGHQQLNVATIHGWEPIPASPEPSQTRSSGPLGAPLYVICKSGGRSQRAVEYLRANGVDAVNVAGGTSAWIESGRPVVTGDQPV